MASRIRRWGAASLLALLFSATWIWAQDTSAPAVLIADEIEVTRDRVLIARGNVEAFQDNIRLTATEVRYDPETSQLSIVGPITIEDGEGIVVLADQAELSRDLQDGLLTGARLVLEDQLQLASVQMNRVGGRYTQLYKTVVTSCRICEEDPNPPLWQIRAKRVIHDSETRQLYFDQAQFRVLGVPIFYLPSLRLPDPTVERASGFLIPSLEQSSLLGFGIKVPYFITLGEQRDLTLTPYISPKTRTLEFRYRQAFERGDVEFVGAVSDDDLKSGPRGYLFGAGAFDLRNDFVLEFDIELTSDDSYLLDYDYSDKDVLDSELRLSRTRRDEYFGLSYIKFKSLREDDEDGNESEPTDVIDTIYQRRLFPSVIGGELRLTALGHTHFRGWDNPFSTSENGMSDELDLVRVTADAQWLKTYQMGGLQVQTTLGMAADTFYIAEEDEPNETTGGLAPRAAVTLRYPMTRTQNGVTQLIEPLAQLGWVGGNNLDVPNEESTRVEFDEGDLLSLSRFPAPDRRERGWTLVYGAKWSRYAADGWSGNLTFGQVLRSESQPDFTKSSGLAGTRSDLLLAGQFELNNGIFIGGRTIIDSDFDIAKAELRGFWSNDRLDLGGSYVWVTEDPAENLPSPISEFILDGAYQLDRHWNASFGWRYDLEANRAARAGGELSYSNECVTIAFSVFRRFTSSTSVEPSTNLGLSVSLQGFSANTGEQTQVRSCGKQAK
ncbi:LPS-assembly protein LptD [Tateyamaria pelophila]|uniref:LPS-assembly protein LptD n=1 Tax=Tateyamaria pelophila TaxID=328415 RepID=UPI001CBB7542|nr:LPS assembly protein LptD [Tateyamaria pelophila]